MSLHEKIARILHKHAEIDFFDARNCDDVAEEILSAVRTDRKQVVIRVIDGRYTCCGQLPTTGHDSRCPAVR